MHVQYNTAHAHVECLQEQFVAYYRIQNTFVLKYREDWNRET